MDTAARVYEIIGRLSPLEGHTVLPADRIVDDLGLHSVRVLELTVELELEFGLRPITEQDAAGIETAGDVVALVDALSKES